MNSKWTMQLSYGLPALALDCALALVAIVKRLVCYSAAVAVLLPIVLISSSVVAFADSATTEGVMARHTVSRDEGIEVHSLFVQLPGDALKHVSLTKNGLANRDHTFFGNLVIEHLSDRLIVTGWRALQLNSQDSGPPSAGRFKKQQLHRIFVQEVRITLPYRAATGGWDVRSLERELERLGVKVKPKPSLPRPTPQLSG